MAPGEQGESPARCDSPPPQPSRGYVDTLGWTGGSENAPVTALYEEPQHPTDEDLLSALERGWQSIDSHTRDVRSCSDTIINGLSLVDEGVRAAIADAVSWHDYGKAVDGWQEATRRVADAAGLSWPSEIAPIGKFSIRESPLLAALTGFTLWREVRRLKSSFAPRLRHEVASALALRQHHRHSHHEPTIHELLAEYLVMSHHGHVRKTLRDELPRNPRRVQREADAVRGIQEGTPVPAVSVDGHVLPATPALSLACRQMGRSSDGAESWTRSVLRLLDHFGPFAGFICPSRLARRTLNLTIASGCSWPHTSLNQRSCRCQALDTRLTSVSGNSGQSTSR